MPLHPDARVRLLKNLKEGLASLRVKHDQFVDSFLAFLVLHKAEEVLPKTGKLRILWEDWIDDTPLHTFVTDRVREELRDRAEYVAGDELRKLADVPGFGDTDSLAELLVAEFESLPWHYTLTTEFPPALPQFPKDRTTVELGAKTRVAFCDLFFRQAYSLSHPDERVRKRVLTSGGAFSILLTDEFDWKDDTAYFQFEAAGFIGSYGTGAQADSANRALRRFVGLALGLKLFKHELKYKPFPTKRFWIVHRKADDEWSIQERLEMDVEDATVLDNIQLWSGFEQSYPEESRLPWLQGLLFSSASQALNVPTGSNLGLAAEWFFDSFKGRDETLTYVRRMTCLEILLGEHGDTSKISLGELLGNRLAYLIGRSHADREKVLKDFREIYGLRSRILHHGKHRFSKDERATLWNLRAFCERAIQEEAKMLTADVEA